MLEWAKDQANFAKSKGNTYRTPASDGVHVQVPAPAKPKGTYNPGRLPWFRAIGSAYL